MKYRAFDKLLIANRGEIAMRIIRTARELGLRTVAVYSTPDAHAPHVRLADEAVHIGPATSAESYLNIDKIIDACRRTGAQAVHPGYGFLSEQAPFARRLEEEDLVFVGPPADAIEAMGDKAKAKAMMIDADVPCVPGYHGEDQSDERFAREAAEIGFPLMVKAAAGGGGRGMRLVHQAEDLQAALDSAKSEATNAFGSGELLLERAVMNPRHVEVQVFADTHGEVIHLGERDCSIQRRHQKVVEEAPSPAMTAELRAQMGAAAVAAARAVGYVGAGTVEFLLGDDGSFYFLEMNTRLQVEHPVTELITGTDLVAWQLSVAMGGHMPMAQEDLVLNGHAIEARLYAEDPTQEFLPQTGRIHLWRPPEGPGVRVDDGVTTGYEITPHYDPMIAKIIASGPNRDVARRRLARALEDCVVLGAITNRAFLVDCITHEVFADGEATTAFIGRAFDSGYTAPTPTRAQRAIAAALLAELRGDEANVSGSFGRWSSKGATSALMRLDLSTDEEEIVARLTGHKAGVWEVTFGEIGEDDEPITVTILDRDGVEARVDVDGVQRTVVAQWNGQQLLLSIGVLDVLVEDAMRRPMRVEAGADGRIVTPMTGKILVPLFFSGLGDGGECAGQKRGCVRPSDLP